MGASIFNALTDLKYNEIVRVIESPDTAVEDFISLKVAFLRNVTINAIANYIKFFSLQRGIKTDIFMGDFDTVFQDVIDPSSALYAFDPDIIILSVKKEPLFEKFINDFVGMSQKDIGDEVERVLSYFVAVLSAIRKNSDVVILVNNFENLAFQSLGILDYQSRDKQVNIVRQINNELLDLCGRFNGVYIVDIDLLQSVVGYTNFIDTRYWNIGKSPYSLEASKLIAFEYVKFICALNGKSKKCLVVDCDNTLWGGIIGEEGIDRIQLGSSYPGSAYVEFQRAILNLYRRGIILAVCSKNNMQDVLDVLEDHPDMVLRKEHFMSMKINWDNKVQNLKEIAAELNIGLDSIVFMDDNPVEIDMISRLIPEVSTILLSGEPSDFRDIINLSGYFDVLTFSTEDHFRNEMYRADINRKKAASMNMFESIEDYYRYLEMEVTIRQADTFSVPRISQLTQRTNQFNLTARRYSEREIREFMDSPDAVVHYLRLKDRFGDSGIVGVVILKYIGEECLIDTFLLSCRVIGRGLEKEMLKNSIESAVFRKCSVLVGEYVQNTKNRQVEFFYQNNGFTQLKCSDNGVRMFTFAVGYNNVDSITKSIRD